MKHLLLILVFTFEVCAGTTLRVATYNLELYVDRPFSDVQPKSELARKYVREVIRAANADVLALQEIGSTNALLELRANLQKEGLDYRYWSHVRAQDENLHVAFLSKVPLVSERHRTNESYLFQGRRHFVARGFGQVEIEPAKNMRVTLMTAHLKSKRMVAEGDQQGMREEEGTVLRDRIDEFLRNRPAGHLIVLGDLNDSFDSRTMRTVLGRGKTALFDTRPAERNGDNLPNANPKFLPRTITWTHYFGKEETYSRLDYILTSQSLRPHLVPSQTYVPAIPNWGAASDHRLVMATFQLD
jgi:endonuclease/exonuclease/phosphatase family metal-dependent hydrolase